MLENYDYADLGFPCQEREEISDLFPSEKDAIFALYEQLFCNLRSVCKETILNSMKYLIFSKEMDSQMEEMIHMTTDEVDVVHHRQLEKEVEQATQELKNKLHNILEDKLF